MKIESWKRWVSRVGVVAVVAALGACGDDEAAVVVPSFIFGTPISLSNNSGPPLEPSVSISGSTVLVAWQDTTPGNKVFLARSQ